jgi:hypothetical protein
MFLSIQISDIKGVPTPVSSNYFLQDIKEKTRSGRPRLGRLGRRPISATREPPSTDLLPAAAGGARREPARALGKAVAGPVSGACRLLRGGGATRRGRRPRWRWQHGVADPASRGPDLRWAGGRRDAVGGDSGWRGDFRWLGGGARRRARPPIPQWAERRRGGAAPAPARRRSGAAAAGHGTCGAASWCRASASSAVMVGGVRQRCLWSGAPVCRCRGSRLLHACTPGLRIRCPCVCYGSRVVVACVLGAKVVGASGRRPACWPARRGRRSKRR